MLSLVEEKNALLYFLINWVGGQAHLSKGAWFAWLLNLPINQIISNWKL